MAVHFGKPGTRKYTGVFRAQLRAGEQKCQELLAFNTKQAARTPPVVVFTGTEVTAIENVVLLCQQKLAQKN
jgi:hypothetical protein